jgi:signal transduction histidine kinase
MRFGLVLKIGTGVLLLIVLSYLYSPKPQNSTFSVPPKTELIVLKSVYSVDSITLTTTNGDVPVTSGSLNYPYLSEILIIVPQNSKELGITHINLNGIHPLFAWFRPAAVSFTSYFDYFYDYRFRLFTQASLLGGAAFLFFLSLITGFISKIKVLHIYSGLSGFVLLLFAFIQPNFILREFFVFNNFPVLFLWILILTLCFIYRVFMDFSPQKHAVQIIQKNALISISSIVTVQLFLKLHQAVVLAEIVFLSGYFFYLYSKVSRFINHYDFHFRVLFSLGGWILWGNILTLFLIESITTGLALNVILMVYMVILAYFISEQLLQELKRNVLLNEENLELETVLGHKAINSAENERKRMAQDLNGDVLKRVYSLTKKLENNHSDLDNIANESQETLQALRNYSYSLYPPYLENLPLGDILKREIEKRDINDWVVLNINVDESLNVVYHRIFKLWVYRIVNEYINAYLHENRISETLNVLLSCIESDIWAFEIFHDAFNLEEFKPILNIDAIDIYARYMNADFSFIQETNRVGWRFVSKFSEIKDEKFVF